MIVANDQPKIITALQNIINSHYDIFKNHVDLKCPRFFQSTKFCVGFLQHNKTENTQKCYNCGSEQSTDLYFAYGLCSNQELYLCNSCFVSCENLQYAKITEPDIKNALVKLSKSGCTVKYATEQSACVLCRTQIQKYTTCFTQNIMMDVNYCNKCADDAFKAGQLPITSYEKPFNHFTWI